MASVTQVEPKLLIVEARRQSAGAYERLNYSTISILF